MRNESSVRPAAWKLASARGVLVLTCLLCPVIVQAQVTGTISGYVQDQAGGVVPGATVTVESAGQQLSRSVQTNAMGFFDLLALPRGHYLIRVELSGFETKIQKDVEVTAGANVRLDFALRVGGLAEQVDVAAHTTMLETRSAAQSNLIDGQRVQDLPMNGRNVVALAGTYAGVTAIRASQDTSDGRQGPIMSVNGGNTNHNLFTLNGAIFTHFNQTTGFNPPPPDAIQEIRIQTHNFSAEYRAHRRQPGEHRVEVGDERVPRHALGISSQLRAERPKLLPDTQARPDAESDGREWRRRDHSQQGVLVRRLSAALGSI